MRDEFYFPSKDGNTEIHTIEWKPEGEVKAVLQLSHGMVEYIKRYDEFAEFMCSHGYYVVGNDHLGHGKSVQSKSEYGFFNEKYGNACVIGDMHTLRQRTAKKYPECLTLCWDTAWVPAFCVSMCRCMEMDWQEQCLSEL